MKSPVNIKGSKSSIGFCLVVTLDSNLEYSKLLEEIKEKFTKSSDFFGDVSAALSFHGRNLTDEEKFEIVGIISECTDLNIVCVTEDDPEVEKKMTQALSDNLNRIEAEAEAKKINSGRFYKGTLRNGQMIDFDTSVIVLGDVNGGAQVVSKGSVVVLGNLNGQVFAGAGGNSHAFVAALNMNPTQIRICDTIARSPDNKHANKKSSQPQIAYCENGNIYIENINRESLRDIQLD